MLLALVFPTSGVKRGLDAIFRHAIIGGSPLQKAKKAGALCEVIRARDWKPQTGDVVRGVQITDTLNKQNSQQLNSLSKNRNLWRERGVIDMWNLPQSTSNHDNSQQSIIQTQVENSAKAITGITKPIHKDRPAAIDVFYVDKISIGHSRGYESAKPSYKMTGLNGRKVHGLCCLPQGFELSIIASQYTVLELNDDNIAGEQRTPPTASTSSHLSRSNPSDISSSYSFAKGIIAIFQTIYASATLYRTKGDQIERYGYAAFGLTVAPYLVMSIINLTGAVLTPDYPTIFMVESEIMEEARRRNGAYFGGTVGKLKPKEPVKPVKPVTSVKQLFDVSFQIDDQNRTIMRTNHFDSNAHAIGGFKNSEEAPQVVSDESLFIVVPQCHDALENSSPLRSNRRDLLLLSLTIAVGLIPVAINGILSRFRAGKSTHAQRVWTMTWLAFGVFVGSTVELESRDRMNGDGDPPTWGSFGVLLLYCGPAIGGFVVVGQMLMNYGHCIAISGGSS